MVVRLGISEYLGYLPYFYTGRTDLTDRNAELSALQGELNTVNTNISQANNKRAAMTAVGLGWATWNYQKIVSENNERRKVLQQAIAELSSMSDDDLIARESLTIKNLATSPTYQAAITSAGYTLSPRTEKKASPAAFWLPAAGIAAAGFLL